MNIIELVQEKIKQELNDFQLSYKNIASPMAIYNDWYIIGFYEEIGDMLLERAINPNENPEGIYDFLYTQSKKHNINILEFLYEEWMHNNYPMNHDWDFLWQWVVEIYDKSLATEDNKQ